MVAVSAGRLDGGVKGPQKRRVLRVRVPRDPPPTGRFQADPFVGGHEVAEIAALALGVVARAGPQRQALGVISGVGVERVVRSAGNPERHRVLLWLGLRRTFLRWLERQLVLRYECRLLGLLALGMLVLSLRLLHLPVVLQLQLLVRQPPLRLWLWLLSLRLRLRLVLSLPIGLAQFLQLARARGREPHHRRVGARDEQVGAVDGAGQLVAERQEPEDGVAAVRALQRCYKLKGEI